MDYAKTYKLGCMNDLKRKTPVKRERHESKDFEVYGPLER